MGVFKILSQIGKYGMTFNNHLRIYIFPKYNK